MVRQANYTGGNPGERRSALALNWAMYSGHLPPEN
jgi:hypothetical protein